MTDESTAVLQGYLERGLTGDAEARRRLLELTRDRLMDHARRHLHGHYTGLERFEQTDDVVQQLYLKVLQNQDRFWVNARGEPVRSLAEFFGHTSAWMRDVLCDLLRKSYGRSGRRAAAVPLSGGTTDGGPRLEPSDNTYDGEQVRRWTEFHEAVAGLPDDLRAVFDLLWYHELTQAEAAAALSIAVPTVKLRWTKARLRVQEALGGGPFDAPGSAG
ncbi:MAG TPA: RNA polymerase sigma factor [Gemmataceae bacterium]|jgi:RNA polymerase sigma factor (sigma-70 family)